MRRFITIAAIAATAAVAVVISSGLLEYSPSKVEEIPVVGGGTALGDTITLFSWNIGYCGYDSDMDFFYDGGKEVLMSEERTKRNLDSIVSEIGKYRNADFILLQEVDLGSKRSYGMNYLDTIAAAMEGFTPYYAANFRSPFVPIPVTDPIGKVESGIVILTRHPAVAVRRHRLPDTSGFPERIFGLKRCLLEAEFILPTGDTLHLFNLHNSAYDDGSRRKAELEIIDSLTSLQYTVFAGDWNCNPPGYNQSEKEKTDPHFSPVLLKEGDIGCKGFAADYHSRTMRYLDMPYVKGITAESLLDFMAYTEGVEPLEVRTIDLGFKNSDHNPVLYRIAFSH